MDVVTFLVVLALIIVFFGMILLYGTKEKSYEQALEEQRKKNENDLLDLTVSKTESSSSSNKKEKTKKNKETVSKKAKVANETSKQSSSKDVTGPVKATTVPVATATQVAVSSSSASKKASKSSPKLHDAEDVASSKANKDIELPKSSKQSEVVDGPVVIEASSLKKSAMQSEKIVVPEVVESATQASPCKSSKAKPSSSPTATLASAEGDSDSRPKKAKRSIQLDHHKVDIKLTDVMEFIKSSVLNEDEVTVLTDALLNRQAYDQSNDFQSFHKKNDPIEALKKKLAEKEDENSLQKINIEAQKRRSDELLAESAILKRRITKLESEKKELGAQVHAKQVQLDNLLKEAYEKKRLEHEKESEALGRHQREVHNLQSEITKLSEQINRVNRALAEKDYHLQEANKLSQQLKEQNDALEHKLEQANNALAAASAKLSLEDTNRDQQLRSLEEEIGKLKSERETLEKDLAVHQQVKSELAQVKQQLEESIHKTDCIAKDARLQLETLEREKTAQLEQLAQLNTRLEHVEEHKLSLAAQVANLTQQLESDVNNSNDLSSLLKAKEESYEELLAIINKIGLSSVGSNPEALSRKVDELKAKLAKLDETDGKYCTLNEIYEQTNAENGTLKSQIDLLRKSLKDETTKAGEYASTLSETEKILVDLQERVIKEKNEQKQKFNELSHSFSEKEDKLKDEMHLLNKTNDNLKIQVSELKELISIQDSKLAAAQSIDASINTDQLKAENKNLKAEVENLKGQLAKLSDLVQIGNQSYHEETQKVQELECTLSCLNGKESGGGGGNAFTTTNGN